jgi:uncharacterized membrane protein YfcA
MMLTSPAAYYVCVSVAIVVLGISKTGFGGGIGILSIPLMAMVMPAQRMVAVLAIVLVVVDLFSNVHYLGEWDWAVLKWLLPGAVAGVGVGCIVLVAMQRWDPSRFDKNLSLAIGLICLAVVAMQVIRMVGKNVPTPRNGPVSGAAVGVVAGAVSTISHSSGPIVSLYLLQERVEKRKLVGTMLLYTLLINSVKLILFVALLRTVDGGTFRATAWMIPLLPVGTITGVWMNKRIPERPFVIIMYVAAAVTAAQMIWKGI